MFDARSPSQSTVYVLKPRHSGVDVSESQGGSFLDAQGGDFAEDAAEAAG